MASPSSMSGNGEYVEIYVTSNGCTVSVANTANSTARILFPNGLSSDSFPVMLGASYALTYDYQVNVTLSTNNPSVSSVTPTGTYWADYGVPFTITTNIIYNSASLPEGQFVDWTTTGGVTLSSSTTQVAYATATAHGTIQAQVDTIDYVVVQPNQATVSFWVFPLILLIYFGLLFMIIPRRHGATTWGRNYSLMTGLVVGSIIGVMSTTLEFFVLLLFLVLWFVYAFRG